MSGILLIKSGAFGPFFIVRIQVHLGVEPTSASFYSSVYDEKENSGGR